MSWMQSPAFMRWADVAAERLGLALDQLRAGLEAGNVVCYVHGLSDWEYNGGRRRCAICMAEREARAAAIDPRSGRGPEPAAWCEWCGAACRGRFCRSGCRSAFLVDVAGAA